MVPVRDAMDKLMERLWSLVLEAFKRFLEENR